MFRSALCLLLLAMGPARARPNIVAAEAVYADIARQIAGQEAEIATILAGPGQDPHLFEPGPATARALTTATIIIYNGAGYDPWMRDLIAATAGAPRRVIGVADLVHAAHGGNPHLWFAPDTMAPVATAIAAALRAAEPDQAASIDRRLAVLHAALAALATRIGSFRQHHRGQTIAATEPIFSLMVPALGLIDRDPDFQRAAMNGTEPSAASIAALEADLRARRIEVLLRNSQTESDATRRIEAIARAARVPVVAISESQPPAMHYQDWVAAILDALDQALRPRS